MSRVAAVLGLLVTSSAVAGIALQVVSYVAAASYFRTFGIEPSDAGISPVNAAFRLNGTFITLQKELVLSAYGGAGSAIVVIITLSVTYRYFHSEGKKARSELIGEIIKPMGERRLREKAELLRNLDRSIRRRSVPFRFLKEALDSKLLTALCGGTLFFLLMLGVANGAQMLQGTGLRVAECVINECQKALVLNPLSTLDQAVLRDLRPQTVNVTWNDPLKIPKFDEFDGDPFLAAYPPRSTSDLTLIATIGDRYYLLLPQIRRTLVVRSAEVTILFKDPQSDGAPPVAPFQLIPGLTPGG